jgi:hypothetical protein
LAGKGGFIEFKGDAVMTFGGAMDRLGRPLAALGSGLLESQKRVLASAESWALHQAEVRAGVQAILESVA